MTIAFTIGVFIGILLGYAIDKFIQLNDNI